MPQRLFLIKAPYKKQLLKKLAQLFLRSYLLIPYRPYFVRDCNDGNKQGRKKLITSENMTSLHQWRAFVFPSSPFMSPFGLRILNPFTQCLIPPVPLRDFVIQTIYHKWFKQETFWKEKEFIRAPGMKEDLNRKHLRKGKNLTSLNITIKWHHSNHTLSLNVISNVFLEPSIPLASVIAF